MKKYNSSLLGWWLIAILFLLSCQKDESVPNPARDQMLSVAAARQWFENNLASAIPPNKSLPERTLQWDLAKTVSLTNGHPAISIPLHYQPTQQGSITQLLLYPDHRGWQAQILKLVCDSAYYSAYQNNISLSNFSGIATYYDWHENFLTGSSFRNGKTTGSISLPSASARSDANCQLVTVSFYTKTCVGGSCTTNKDFEIEYIECPDQSGSGSPLPRGPLGGGGGIPQPKQPVTYALLTSKGFTIPGQDKTPINLNSYLDCFGSSVANASYQITVYVDEPVAGTGETKFGLNVGHAFVGLKRTGADGTSTEQVFGFYPSEYTTDWVKSKFVDNGSSPYTVSATYAISADQFRNAVNAARYMTGEMYNIQSQNCTDAVFYIFDATGIGLPKTQSTFLFGAGMGHSPGQLGLDLRNQSANYPISTARNYAPGSKGPC